MKDEVKNHIITNQTKVKRLNRKWTVHVVQEEKINGVKL